MTSVLFWDIDGTLLTTGRAGIFAWEDAVRTALGVPVDLADFQTAGLTDVEIGFRLLAAYGSRKDPEVARRLLRVYEEQLPACLPRRQGRVLPGVRETLGYLANKKDVVSLLLTGNTRAGANAKLAYYGLAGYFREGAFAEDAPDRTSIAFRALALAQELLGDSPSPETMYVIGDTPHDVNCGKAIMARTIALATGAYSVADLRSYDPWLAMECLPSPEDFYGLVHPQPRQSKTEFP